MNRYLLLACAGLATLSMAGCATFNVRTDSDAALVGTVHCHSVAWAGGFKGNSSLRSTIANPLNESRLRDAIAANLQKAGITLVDKADSADCLVGYGIGERQTLDTVYPDGWAFGAGYRRWGPGPWWGGGWGWDGELYNQSFIAVDLYDAKGRKPMWHATAEQNLDNVSGDEAARRIRAAVDAIFVKFPR